MSRHALMISFSICTLAGVIASRATAQSIPLPQQDSTATDGVALQITNTGTKNQPTAIQGEAPGKNGVGISGIALSRGAYGVKGVARGAGSVGVWGSNDGSGTAGQFVLTGAGVQYGQTALLVQNTGGLVGAGNNGRYGTAGFFQITNPDNFDSALKAQTIAEEGTAIEGDDFANVPGGGIAILGQSNQGLSAQFTGGSGGTGTCSYDGSAGWNCPAAAARTSKRASVNDGQLLNRLAALPLFEYSLKDATVKARYLGPTAEDFNSAFHLGANDKSINTANAQGVALAAAKALYTKLKQDELKIAALERLVQQQKLALEDVATLKAAVAQLKAEQPIRQASLR